MLEFISAFAKTNPVLSGMGMATGAGFLLSHAKELPKNLWAGFKSQFSTSITVYSEDQVFEYLDRWLAAHPSTKKMRRLGVAEWYEEGGGTGGKQFNLTPGTGTHLLWVGGRPFFVTRHLDSDNSSSTGYAIRRKQSLHITTPGRDQKAVRDLLTSVRSVRVGGDNKVPVYMWMGTDRVFIDARPKRSLDTIYTDQKLKDDLVKDLTKFHAARKEYQNRGTPWRRAICSPA